MSILPDFYAKNIFEIPVSFYKKLGIKYLLVDLDNTLDAYDVLNPSERVFVFKQKLLDEGIEMIIISNNRGKRVSTYANKLNVKYLANTGKPFGFRLKKFILNNNYGFDECMLCGDQLITDVTCGKRTGIKVLLLDPIVKKDQWTTRFNRLFDRPRRKKLIEKGLIKHLKEEDYGK